MIKFCKISWPNIAYVSGLRIRYELALSKVLRKTNCRFWVLGAPLSYYHIEYFVTTKSPASVYVFSKHRQFVNFPNNEFWNQCCLFNAHKKALNPNGYIWHQGKKWIKIKQDSICWMKVQLKKIKVINKSSSKDLGRSQKQSVKWLNHITQSLKYLFWPEAESQFTNQMTT